MMDEWIREIGIKEMGARLKWVRQRLALTQTEVANEIGSTQLAISKMERGECVRSPSFLAVLLFYSQSVSMDYLFGKNFDPSDPGLMDKDYALASVVRQKLVLLKEDLDKGLSELKGHCDEQLDASIELI